MNYPKSMKIIFSLLSILYLAGITIGGYTGHGTVALLSVCVLLAIHGGIHWAWEKENEPYPWKMQIALPATFMGVWVFMFIKTHF